MTEQKPPGMSWESWIDQQIREAREAGLFDNLPGAGKPLPNVADGYDPLWWVKQLVQREQISVLPRPSRCFARSNPSWRPSGSSPTKPRSGRESRR